MQPKEKTMTTPRKFVAAAIFLAMAASPALAQMGHEGGGMGGMSEHGMMNPHPMMSPCNMTSHVEGRLAFLKTELKITEKQNTAWEKVATIIRDRAKKMSDKRDGMMKEHKDRPAQSPSLPERLQGEEKRLNDRIDALKTVSGPVTELYAQLTPDQKKTADEVLGGPMGVVGCGGFMPMLFHRPSGAMAHPMMQTP